MAIKHLGNMLKWLSDWVDTLSVFMALAGFMGAPCLGLSAELMRIQNSFIRIDKHSHRFEQGNSQEPVSKRGEDNT